MFTVTARLIVEAINLAHPLAGDVRDQRSTSTAELRTPALDPGEHTG